MQRFYIPSLLASETLYISDAEMIHQMTKVLRAKIGDMFIFFDGRTQSDFVYKLQEIEKKNLVFSLLEEIEKKSELDFHLTLYQALPNKLEKVEYILQKCSEVGFRSIIFFPSQRSQKLTFSENKKERLNKIMQEAIEQCGRNWLCEVEFCLKIRFPKESETTLVFHQEKNHTSKYLKEVSIKKGQNVNIFV